MAHNFIYLGKEKGTRTVFKVGMTTQTCYARCKNSDYKIGCAFEILSDIPIRQLLDIEDTIIKIFDDKFSVAHGREYFKVPQKEGNWDSIKILFCKEMKKILTENDYIFKYEEGWVKPRTY